MRSILLTLATRVALLGGAFVAGAAAAALHI